MRQRRDFKVGDLILISNKPSTGYLNYPYAVIIYVKQDNDGHARSITARMSNGTVRTRDISKIVLIYPVDQR